MSDMFRQNKAREPITLTKTRKALDWACACLIRLPIVALFLALLLVAVGLAVLIISPENVYNALHFLGIMKGA